MTPSQRNIVICIRTLNLDQLGGAEVQALRIAALLKERGYTVSFLAGRNQWHWFQSTMYDFNGQVIPIVWLSSPSLRMVGAIQYLAQICLWLAIHRRQFATLQVISINAVPTLVANWAGWLGYHVVIRAQAGETHRPPLSWRHKPTTPFHNLIWRLHVRSINQIPHVIAQSDDLADEFRELGVDDHRIVIIKNGIDTEVFSPEPDNKAALRRALQLPLDRKLICCVAGLRPAKGVQYAIRAHALLLRQYPDCDLVLVGDGPLRAELEKLTRELDMQTSVHFVGFATNVPQYLKACDIFVMSSESEGHPNALIEAMAVALPVVAHDVRGIRDVVTQGVNGILVPLADTTAMANALYQILTDDDYARKLGDTARHAVLEHYDNRQMIERYIHLMNA